MGYKEQDIMNRIINDVTREVPFEYTLIFTPLLAVCEDEENGIYYYDLQKMKYGRKEYLNLRDEIRNLKKRTLIISDLHYLFLTNRMLWECNNAVASVCIDSEDAYPVEAGVSKVDYKVWDFQTFKAEKDDYAFMSGWCNSYNGKKFTQDELDEYINDAFQKVSTVINKDSRVLEVGIGSGMIAYPLIPLCKQYDGCDFSEQVLEVLQKRLSESGYHHTNLYHMSAHEVGTLPDSYDCILMSSVTEYFSGYNYMIEVVSNCINKIDGKGNIFFLDIFDLDRLDDYKKSVAEYGANLPKGPYKKDFTHELYFPRNFWPSLQAIIPGIKSVEVTDKIGVIDNEINNFRYDVRVEVDKHINTDKEKAYKQQFGFRQTDTVQELVRCRTIRR